MTIETLTGRTIYCMDDSFNYGNYGDIAIDGVSVWEKDGMKRTYINLSGGGARLIAKLFIVNEGKARADFSIDTAYGKVCGLYGGYASSGAKQHAARAMAEALFA